MFPRLFAPPVFAFTSTATNPVSRRMFMSTKAAHRRRFGSIPFRWRATAAFDLALTVVQHQLDAPDVGRPDAEARAMRFGLRANWESPGHLPSFLIPTQGYVQVRLELKFRLRAKVG